MRMSGASPSSPKTPKPGAPPKAGSFRQPEPCPDHMTAFTSSKPEQIEASRRLSADFQRGLQAARETIIGSSPGGLAIPAPSSSSSFKGASSPKAAGSPKANNHEVWRDVFNPGRNYNMPKHAERFDTATNGSPTTWCAPHPGTRWLSSSVPHDACADFSGPSSASHAGTTS